MYSIIIITISFIFSGCLTFHRISYELNLENDLEGRGVIKVYDIRSDAETEKDFEEDKNSLFDYMHKSDEFISDMLREGKDITSRRLYIKDNLLNAEVKLNFDDIRNVEGVSFEEDYYYLTLDLEDSVNATNGKVIYSDDFKRIVWDKNVKTILFDMIAVEYKDNSYKDLAPYYKVE